jgi:hypothetical protein
VRGHDNAGVVRAPRGTQLPHSRRPVGVGPRGLHAHDLPPVPGHRRKRAQSDGVHGRALHRHLPPDEGQVDLHHLEGQKDHCRVLDVCRPLLFPVVPAHHHKGGRENEKALAFALPLASQSVHVRRIERIVTRGRFFSQSSS